MICGSLLTCILLMNLSLHRLKTSRGLPALVKLFDGVKFKGKGHEVSMAGLWLLESNLFTLSHTGCFPHMAVSDIYSLLLLFQAADLYLLMTRLEHWSHRLFPKMTFDECIQRLEKLGAKREVRVMHITCIIHNL